MNKNSKNLNTLQVLEHMLFTCYNNKVRIQFFSELDKLTLVVELGGWEGPAPEVWILVLSSPHGSWLGGQAQYSQYLCNVNKHRQFIHHEIS